MATNFPTSLDNLTNPAGSDPVNNPSHASQHANINDAIENLETKVGVNNSTVTTSLDYRVKQLETNPTYTNEEAVDAVALALAAGTHSNITINYNDTGNSISISAAAGYTDEEARDAIALALRGSGGITISSDDVSNTITISVDNTIATKTYVDTAVTNLGNTSATLYVPVSEVGQADGIATLDATGKVPLTQLGNLIDGAPTALNTLNELAAALGNDSSYAATITTALGNKVSKAGGDVITSSLPGVIGLTVKAAASQTADLQQWQNSAGTVLARINSIGTFTNRIQIYADNTSSGSYSLVARTNYNTVTPVSIQAAASQTANLTNWTNSSGVDTLRVLSGGSMLLGNVNVNAYNYISFIKAGGVTGGISGLRFGSDGDGSNQQTLTVNTADAHLTVTNLDPAGTFIIKGAASQTANLQEWRNSAGTVLAGVGASGLLSVGNTTGTIQVTSSGTSGSYPSSGAGIELVAGANSATDLIQAYNRGTNAWRNLEVRTGKTSFLSQFASSTVLIVKGAASQTADLQQWQNSAGTVLSKIDSTGAMFTTTAAANTNTTQVATTAYVQTELADLVNSAPATLDTLKELSDALGADANFATTVTNNLALKAPLASPTLTGTPAAPTATTGTNSTQIATTAFVKTEISNSVQPGAVYQTSAPSSPAVGQIWIDSDENVTTFDSNIIRRKAITATAGQTVFTADLPFIDGFEQIFMNGLLLVKTTDYATSNSNTVTLTSAAAASDVIEIVSVTGANSVNTYTQAEVNALLAANTSVAPLSISANTNILAKKRYFVTSASALTLTLPASPALNDEIQIVDASGNASTYNITVARNANKINGGTNNLIIDTNGGWYTLLYTGATYGWKVG